MLTLLRHHELRALFIEEIPSLLVALVIAQRFYKFGSFAPECLAFLVTWYACSWLGEQMMKMFHHMLRLRKSQQSPN